MRKFGISILKNDQIRLWKKATISSSIRDAISFLVSDAIDLGMADAAAHNRGVPATIEKNGIDENDYIKATENAAVSGLRRHQRGVTTKRDRGSYRISENAGSVISVDTKQDRAAGRGSEKPRRETTEFFKAIRDLDSDSTHAAQPQGTGSDGGSPDPTPRKSAKGLAEVGPTNGADIRVLKTHFVLAMGGVFGGGVGQNHSRSHVHTRKKCGCSGYKHTGTNHLNASPSDTFNSIHTTDNMRAAHQIQEWQAVEYAWLIRGNLDASGLGYCPCFPRASLMDTPDTCSKHYFERQAN